MEKLYKKYLETLENYNEFDQKIQDINNLSQQEVQNFRKEFQKIYDSFIDIQLKLSNEVIKDASKRGKDIECTHNGISGKNTPDEIILFSEKRANVVQFRYLYPLNIKLSEFAEEEAKQRDNIAEIKARERDYKLFKYSILISTVLGAVLGVVVSYAFDKQNDKDLKKIREDIKIEHNSIIEKNDSLIHLNNELINEVKKLKKNADSN